MSLFFVWLLVMVVYASLAFYRMQRERNVDILPIYIYNGLAYWKKDNVIYCSEINNNSIDIKTAHIVDPLNLKNIDQVDYLFIHQELEDMEK